MLFRSYINREIPCEKVPTGKMLNEAKLINFIENDLASVKAANVDEFEEMLLKIENSGYSLEELAVALLRDKLNLNENDTDLNDYSVSRNDDGRRDGRRDNGGRNRSNRSRNSSSDGRKRSYRRKDNDSSERKSGDFSKKKRSFGKKSDDFRKSDNFKKSDRRKNRKKNFDSYSKSSKKKYVA